MTQNYLKCNYVSDHPFLQIGPIKQEMLSLKPWIVIYHEVISERVAKHMKQIFKPSNLFRSTTTDVKGQMMFVFFVTNLYSLFYVKIIACIF
jgi:hypothetical protein